MKISLFSILPILILSSFQCLYSQNIKTLSSPDGKLLMTVEINESGDLSYSLRINKKLIINKSAMGYQLEGGITLPASGCLLKSSEENSVNSEWKPVWGKRAIVADQYNELILNLTGPDLSSISLFRIEVRAYNDGVAFRYCIPPDQKNILDPTSEITRYNFAGDYTAWFYNGEHENIGPERLSVSNGKRLPVMTIKADNDVYLAIHEACLGSGDPLVLESKKNDMSFSVISKPGKMEAGFKSAWRVILCGNTPGKLVDSHLIELLNPDPSGDFSWVKPGVAVWDWRINGAIIDGFTYTMEYPSWVRMVDFAAENNIRYLVLDANWYGPEHEAGSDPVKGDKAADVRRLLQYGKEKGIGIWLYLNDVGGRKYPIEQTLKQYGDWGAAGIKYGFMNGTPAEKNIWTRRITELCAQNHLLCDFHDGPVHPYGQMRTWPNALTREFCHAQLDAHRVFVPGTFVTTVFVNMLAGPIDMNNGVFDLRKGNTTRIDENQPVPSTLVSEAARTLIVFSGVTIIPDIPEYYKKYPELLNFISEQKMPWQESKTLTGEIGEYIVMARQNSEGIWLVGATTNESSRVIDIPLNFLEKGNYEVTIIQDGENAHYLNNREEYKSEKKTLHNDDHVRVKLAAGGGACLIIKEFLPPSLAKDHQLISIQYSEDVLQPQPTKLTVNFMLYPDMVLSNGYPVNIGLKEAVERNENFRFVEVGHKQPLFGWVLNSDKDNTVQSAYRIIMGSSLADVKNDSGDFWDSGKTESKQSINIPYTGKQLLPESVYYWKVKTWDNHGDESEFSAIQSFLTSAELSTYPGTTVYPLQKQDIPPERIISLDKYHTLIDFGKAGFGRLRINLYGKTSADTVRLFLGEKLKDGIIDRNPGASIRCESFTVALKPGWNTYEILIPQHYYKSRPERIFRMPDYIGRVMPFRYCEVENYEGKLLTADKIQQITVHYPFDEEASYFHSSDTVLNAVWDMCKHTIKATSFCGIYVDGDRERFPREADSYINQLSHYTVDREFSLARYTHEFQIKYSSQWTEWLMHVVLMAWEDYMATGDPSSLENFYEDLKAKSLIALAREDGLISTRTGLVTWDVINSVHWQKTEWSRQKKDMPVFRDIVDWPQSGTLGLTEKQGETDNFEFTDINSVVNAFHYRTIVLMEQIAEVLNKTEDAAFFEKRAALVRQSFNNKLLDKHTGIYVDGEGSKHSSLHTNMFAVAHGLASEKNLPALVEFIKGRGLVCSPYGSLYLLESLYRAGEADAALDFLTSTSERSWARWIYEFGSTITLEAWGPEYKPNLDWSHAWGSAPASIISRKLMGIEALEPGYRKIRIKPQPGSLKDAEIKLPTIRGDVKVSFNNEPGQKFEMEVTIPANMQADIYMPFWNNKQIVTQNGKPVKFVKKDGMLKIENIGSGTNIFMISK